MNGFFFEVGLLVLTFTFPGVVLLLLVHHCSSGRLRLQADLAIVAVWCSAGSGAYLFTDNGHAFSVALMGAAVTKYVQSVSEDYLAAGHILFASAVLSLPIGIGWSASFVLARPVSGLTRSMLLVLLCALSFLAALRLLAFLQTQSYLFRTRWRRPRHALPPVKRNSYPKVSLHVPCYSEPPEVVCATLDALNRLDYPDFEVLVVDNNTKDPCLWEPVRTHCQKLGARFRFFHVDPLSGAKAGALNFALAHTCTDAQLIGIIDADYQAAPDYLQQLVGFFDDPVIGFVQTPHDYRQWRQSLFQRSCYWEYKPSYWLRIACLNEWSASYIIGTMCLIRRKALESAGGWATWCLTEDSECAVRIHALGYQSVYVTQTAGRGLIPESFHEYKKQRLRWTVGPIQQLKRYWRFYLFGRLAKPSQLTGWQRLLELSHSLEGLSLMVAVILFPLGLATITRMVYINEIITIPKVIWMILAATLPCLPVIRWLTYKLAGCTELSDMIAGTLAAISLIYIRLIGAFIGWFSKNGIPWRRTCKFPKHPDKFKALLTVRAESLLAVGFFLLAACFGLKAQLQPPDLVCLASAGLFATGLIFLCAPVMAVMAEYRPAGRSEKSSSVANATRLPVESHTTVRLSLCESSKMDFQPYNEYCLNPDKQTQQTITSD